MMHDQKSIKIAVLPTRRGISSNRKGAFTAEDALAIKNSVLRMLAQGKPAHVTYVGIDFLNNEGIMYDESHAEPIIRMLQKEQVDGIFILHCNFGCEEVVGRVCGMLRKPVFLWGPRDNAIKSDGSRSTDTQCGLFASSRLLRRYGIPFTYAQNCWMSDDAFTNQFRIFLGAVRVAEAMKHMRIGQVCARPKYFNSVMVNESQLLEQLGIVIVPINLAAVTEQMERILTDRVDLLQAACEDLQGRMDCSATDTQTLEKTVALKLALRELAEFYHLDGLAIECWTVMPQTIQALPCLAIGELTDEGLPCCCETDIYGVVGSIMLHAASDFQCAPFFGEYTMRDSENDQQELIWHCGNAPYSLKAAYETAALVGGRESFSLRPGAITIVRFDSDRNQFYLFADEAEAVQGARTTGTYYWARVRDWPAWERKFIYGPYIHHVSCSHGLYKEILRESCKYIPEIKFDCMG